MLVFFFFLNFRLSWVLTFSCLSIMFALIVSGLSWAGYTDCHHYHSEYDPDIDSTLPFNKRIDFRTFNEILIVEKFAKNPFLNWLYWSLISWPSSSAFCPSLWLHVRCVVLLLSRRIGQVFLPSMSPSSDLQQTHPGG